MCALNIQIPTFLIQKLTFYRAGTVTKDANGNYITAPETILYSDIDGHIQPYSYNVETKDGELSAQENVDNVTHFGGLKNQYLVNVKQKDFVRDAKLNNYEIVFIHDYLIYQEFDLRYVSDVQ